MNIGRVIDIALTIFFFLLGILAYWGVSQFPFDDRLFPVTAAVLMIVCSLIYGVRILTGHGDEEAREENGVGASPSPFSPEQLRTVLWPVLAVVILVAGVLIIGHLIAVPVFVFAYMTIKREPIWIGALGAAGMFLFIKGLLIKIMHVPMPHPLLGNWLPF
ncbi:tripartite tricarboxylate transporter TctB family protein [Frigidibacter sp. ROC022]|uniref:tripartite tricarboxylate transporter TctB family protein n=1 Tax=Frigidibacter sp. ROC022 TaxID=2971796 RepID=UPI00215B0780|nr:tripartite tricarboxylate transporter TctB family protein [Frigidibacter sp. ROC022]MCR8724534.1 tripartite tricarboxylate transporter TctB family protein [Frigidibacter sp. ROC022]